MPAKEIKPGTYLSQPGKSVPQKLKGKSYFSWPEWNSDLGKKSFAKGKGTNYHHPC